MPNPTASDVHVNTPLTNISVAYIQRAERFIADKVFPIVPVEKQSDRYFRYDKSDWHRIQAAKRAPGTESAGGGWRIDNTPTYFCDVYAVHKDIDDQTRQNAQKPIDMDRDATEWTTQQLMLLREKIWAENYMKSGIWGTELTGVAATPGAGQFLQWDQANSTPIEDVENARMAIAQQTGYVPNVLVLGPHVFSALKNHPSILDRVKYTQRAVITTDILAGLFEVDKVLVPMAVIETAAEGAPSNMQFIFPKAALLCYAEPNPGILKPSAGYIFAWTGLFGAGAYGNRIKRFRMEHLASDRIEGEMAFDARQVAPDLGAYFANAVA
ncbi:MAG: hypothetical protein HPY55_15835 [Firmicutes bacterium]|nr:hypothetical protein [Bacillota bacterium]